MKNAEVYILKQIESINELIRKNINKEENIKLKNEFNNILYLISLTNKFDINKNDIEDILVLPEEKTGYSEFRIINDCESDNKEYWTECKINNKAIRLYPNDIIIKKK